MLNACVYLGIIGFASLIQYSAAQPCTSIPCQNGGSCVDNGDDTFTCNCIAGYSGLTCQTNIDECASNPCQAQIMTDVPTSVQYATQYNQGTPLTSSAFFSVDYTTAAITQIGGDMNAFGCQCDGLATINSTIYCASYCDDNVDQLVGISIINPITGAPSFPGGNGLIGPQTDISCTNGGMYDDLAVHPVTKEMYGIARGTLAPNTACFDRINPFTGANTIINSLVPSGQSNVFTQMSLEFNGDGTILYYTERNFIWVMNPATGGITFQATINLIVGGGCGNAQINSLDFNNFDNLFYGIVQCGATAHSIARVDPVSGVAIIVGPAQNSDLNGITYFQGTTQGSGSSCVDGINGYQCLACPIGLSGSICQTNIDECASTPCKNGGTCIDLINGFNCTCVLGFSGTLCQTNVDECASIPCQNGGTCVSDGIESFSCACMVGYTGFFCETNINECGSNPCQNGGTCADNVNGYICSCGSGFSGIDCQTDIDECVSNPCHHSGTCVNAINGFSCTCQPGYSGINCQTEIDECVSNPCLNGGICIDSVNGFSCVCAPGTIQPICTSCGPGSFSSSGSQLSCTPCDPGTINSFFGQTNCTNCTANTFSPNFSGTSCNTCGNNQFSGSGAIECLPCASGYTGVGCITDIDECSSIPCANGGTCFDLINAFNCTCPHPFSGTNCQDGGTCFNNPCQNGGTCSPCQS
jgi:hypothetical protein